MLRSLLDAFWNEDVWLPPNTTWEDIAPGPDKAVVYSDHRHLLYVVPLAFALLGIRHLLEKYVFAPFGKSLGIKNSVPKRAPYNLKLETAYQNAPKLEQQRITALAKQLDLSERQVERWWRLRRNQDKTSTLVKFCESMWRCTFHLYNFCYGLLVLWDKEWFWDIKLCYIGYPHHSITNDIWWYHLIWIAFFLSLTISQFRDVRRKDFWQMFIHHVSTITTSSIVWVLNLQRPGSWVYVVHDCSDMALEAGKAAKYAKYQKLSDGIFIVFIILWIITRLGIFPFHIVATSLAMLQAAYYIIHFFLSIIIILHLLWTWYIIKLAYNTFYAGQYMQHLYILRHGNRFILSGLYCFDTKAYDSYDSCRGAALGFGLMAKSDRHVHAVGNFSQFIPFINTIMTCEDALPLVGLLLATSISETSTEEGIRRVKI